MPYKYDEQEKVLREMPTMERPLRYAGTICECLDCNEYNQHIASLKTIPTPNGLPLPDGYECVEGKDFLLKYEWRIKMHEWHECTPIRYYQVDFVNTEKRIVAIPIEGEKKWDKLNREFDAALESATKEDFERIAKKVEGEKKEEKDSLFNIPDGEEDWTIGSETFTRKEVFKLLYTQRAMITNDLKRYAGKDLTDDIYAIINHPRTPKF